MYRVLELNPQLIPFAGDIEARMYLYNTTKARLLSEGQTLKEFANGYRYYGFHHVVLPGVGSFRRPALSGRRI